MFYQTLNEAALRKALGTEVLKAVGWGGDRMRFVVTERKGRFGCFLKWWYPKTPPK